MKYCELGCHLFLLNASYYQGYKYTENKVDFLKK